MSEAQEKIQYFRTILLKVNQVFSWVYGEDFSLIESNCTWEMVLKNFFLLDSRERLLEIQEKVGTLPFHFTDGLSFTWIVVPFEKNFFVLGPILFHGCIGTIFSQADGNPGDERFLPDQVPEADEKYSCGATHDVWPAGPNVLLCLL